MFPKVRLRPWTGGCCCLQCMRRGFDGLAAHGDWGGACVAAGRTTMTGCSTPVLATPPSSQLGTHHMLEDFGRRGEEPKDQIQVYTWLDATLRCVRRDLPREVSIIGRLHAPLVKARAVCSASHLAERVRVRGKGRNHTLTSRLRSRPSAQRNLRSGEGGAPRRSSAHCPPVFCPGLPGPKREERAAACEVTGVREVGALAPWFAPRGEGTRLSVGAAAPAGPGSCFGLWARRWWLLSSGTRPTHVGHAQPGCWTRGSAGAGRRFNSGCPVPKSTPRLGLCTPPGWARTTTRPSNP